MKVNFLEFKKGTIIQYGKQTKPSLVKPEQPTHKKAKKSWRVSDGSKNNYTLKTSAPRKPRKLPERDARGRFISQKAKSQAKPPALKEVIIGQIINSISKNYGTNEANEVLNLIIDKLNSLCHSCSSDELFAKFENYATLIEPELGQIAYRLEVGHYEGAIDAASNLILILTGEVWKPTKTADELTAENIIQGDNYDDYVYE